MHKVLAMIALGGLMIAGNQYDKPSLVEGNFKDYHYEAYAHQDYTLDSLTVTENGNVVGEYNTYGWHNINPDDREDVLKIASAFDERHNNFGNLFGGE
jgi:hypothetical protein